MKFKLFSYFVIFCFVTFNSIAAELNLSVDKKVLSEGDVLFLTISYDGNQSSTPDFDALRKDFAIVSNSTSHQTNIINGVVSQSKKWTLGLQPLRIGKITISPIRFDGLVSNSEEIEVKELTDVAVAPDIKENSNAPFFQIDQELDNKGPYIQQQSLLFVNIYDSLGLRDGSLSVNEESKKDWIMIPISNKPIVRQAVINNRKMNVETYVFAIFAQRSGKINLPQISFSGYYIKDSGFGFPAFDDDAMFFGVNLHNVFGQQVPVKMKTRPEAIEVMPIPSQGLNSEWLPLKSLELSSSWSARNGFKVGEAVTRSIQLKAVGMTESMLPKISFPRGEGFNQYPEKPVVSEKVEKGQIITTAQINNVYIPTQSGNIIIPEVKVNWFNVETNQFETAVIKEETIFVIPNSNIKEKETEKEEKDETAPKLSIEEETTANTKEAEKSNFLDKNSYHIDLIDLFKIIAAVLLSVMFLLLFNHHRKKNKERNDVIKALKNCDYKRVKECLILWAEKKFYPVRINNFNDISDLVDDEQFTEQLFLLNKLLYSDNVLTFNPVKFIGLFKKIDKNKNKKLKKSETLPNLYD